MKIYKLVILAVCFLLIITACSTTEDVQPQSSESGASNALSSSLQPKESASSDSETSQPDIPSSSLPEKYESSVTSSQKSSSESSTAPETPAQVPSNNLSKMPALSEIESIYARNYSGYSYIGTPVDLVNQNWDYETQIVKWLALFDGLEPLEENPPISDNEFLLWTKDGTRHVYGTSRGGYFIADGKTYALPQDRLSLVETFFSGLLSGNDPEYGQFFRPYPMWLIWMTPSKIQEVIFYSPEHGALTMAPDVMHFTAKYASECAVTRQDSTYTLGAVDFTGDDVFHLVIRFSGGISYNIYAKGRDYFVESSDMSYGCRYKFPDGAWDSAEHLIEQYEFFSTTTSMAELLNPAT